MAFYRKKPVVIEAYHWCPEGIGGEPELDTPWLIDGINKGDIRIEQSKMSIRTLEGTITASAGDYIIKGINGEIYPCKPDIFEKTYDKVI